MPNTSGTEIPVEAVINAIIKKYAVRLIMRNSPEEAPCMKWIVSAYPLDGTKESSWCVSASDNVSISRALTRLAKALKEFTERRKEDANRKADQNK